MIQFITMWILHAIGWAILCWIEIRHGTVLPHYAKPIDVILGSLIIGLLTATIQFIITRWQGI